jgi:Flp pilus assembly protein TadG
MRRTLAARRPRREGGSIIIFVTLGAFALFALTALALETGRAWSAKGQLQAATDASALAAAGSLLVDDGATADPAAALAAAQTYAPQHDVIGTAVQLRAADVETGSWDLASRTFTPLPGSTDADVVRAVRVVGRRDATQNGELATVLGRVVGVDGIPVTAEAIGYLGFAGIMPPGTAELPIAIDCCAIGGNTPGEECGEDYCDTIANPPNPCPLERDPSKTVTCLEFFSTPEQNACWTAFDSEHPSVNVPDLEDIIEDQNQTPVGPDPVFLDNGTKTPVVRLIRDRFLGEGEFSGNPSGEDTDGDGVIDSWPVTLPIVECQNPGDQCASGDPARIIGVACFDLQEVLVTPEKIIKGEFVCESDPRFERCDTGGFGTGGGFDAGIDAQAPVLVR